MIINFTFYGMMVSNKGIGGMPVFKIAICDDDVSELSNIISIMNEYKELNIFRHEITYTAFQSAVDLIAAVEGGNLYDIILLDIVMPQMSGIEAAREIRSHDKVAKIIFLTFSTEFAIDSYAVDAFFYALKPIWKDKLFTILDKVFAVIHSQPEPSILVKCKTGLTRIPLHILEYAEITGRTVCFHLINGIVFEETGVMSKLEKVLLEYPQFVKPHRSFIVNLDCIDVLTLKEVKLFSNANIPVAKANYADVKASYIARAFEKAGEKVCSLR